MNVTDRAQRYRAQKTVTGPRRCVICGSKKDLGVMHLDGNESHGEKANLAWGCRSCNQILAAAFKRQGLGRPTNQYNPAKGGVPTFDQYRWAVYNHSRGEHDEGGAVIHATPKHKRIEYARRIAAFKAKAGTGKRGSDMPDWARNPGRKVWNVFVHGQYLGTVEGATKAAALKKALSKFGRSIHELKRAGIAVQRNPASGSAQVFEDFHGYPPTEVVKVTKEIHRHAHLASLGTLVSLDVWGVDDRGHKITGFKKAQLCSNEDRNQLFIEGGDQSINLKDFGIKAHEMETLGRVTNIAYQTNKTHLGEEGGRAVYIHKFRTTNDNGKHVTVRMTREPDLVYDVRNEQLLFSGGSYEILREGINK